jgi:predicted phosphoribosyltransferase
MVRKSIITSKCKSCIFQLSGSTVYVALERVLQNAEGQVFIPASVAAQNMRNFMTSQCNGLVHSQEQYGGTALSQHHINYSVMSPQW